MIHTQYNLIFRKIKAKSGRIYPICTTINPEQYIPLTNELACFITVSYDYFIDIISQEIQEMWDGTWDGLIADEDNLYVANNGNELEIDLSTGNAYIKFSSAVYSNIPTITINDLKSILDEFIAFRNS